MEKYFYIDTHLKNFKIIELEYIYNSTLKSKN